MKLLKFKKVIFIFLVITIIFYLNLNRIRTASMYFFMARSAPWNIKWSCIQKTEIQVNQKFTLPLLFDNTSKNALREFWHYSYFRSCLNNLGYDIHGQSLPKSSIIEDNSNYKYTNPQAKISFISPNKIEITKNNQINPDYDDRILMSDLLVNNQKISLHVYTKHDDIRDLNSAQDIIKHFSSTSGKINSNQILNTNSNHSFLLITQDDKNTGIIFITSDNRIIEFFSSELSPEAATQLANQIFF